MTSSRFAAFLLAALSAFALFIDPAFAQTTVTSERPATFTLGNGLQVVVIPDHRTPVVTQMIWYKVGSADETPGKSGLAHFLEHLMFKGTSQASGRRIFRRPCCGSAATRTPSPRPTTPVISSACRASNSAR